MKLGEIAEKVGASLEGDAEHEITGLAPIDGATDSELTFVANPRYVGRIADSHAGAIIIGVDVDAKGKRVLRVADPYLAFTQVLDLFFQPLQRPEGIHPTAVIDPSAVLGARAYVGPHVVIGERVSIGDDARIEANVVLYADSTMGDRFLAHSGVVVRERSVIGDDVTLQPGAVIGGDGFGYVLGATGVRTIPRAGNVVIENEVEVGANTTIDRATIGSTRIRYGAKIDNLVMIAHGCDIGEFAFLAGQSGFAGSTTIGAGVQVGGQAGSAGHLTVGAGARLAAGTGITKDLAPGKSYMSVFQATDLPRWQRIVAATRRLPDLVKRVRRIEKHLELS